MNRNGILLIEHLIIGTAKWSMKKTRLSSIESQPKKVVVVVVVVVVVIIIVGQKT